jgi:uroporphyrinogen decarboxylase
MNSKERVLAATNIKEPDRTPLFVEVVPEVEQKLYNKYKLKGNELLTFLGNDIVNCAVGVADSWGKTYRGGNEVDEWGIGWKTIKHGSGEYTEMIYKPLEKTSFEDLKSYKIPDPEDEKRYYEVIRLKEKFGDKYAVMVDLSCTIFELSWYLRGMDNLLMDMFTNKRFVNLLMDRILEFYVPAAKKLAKLDVNIIWIGDDVGMQTGMIMSPEMFREFLKERYRLLIDEIKRTNRNVKVAFHSDGFVTPIISDLIEVGVDILNPVQPKCMDPAEIKEKFGKDLCFMGTIDEQETLPFGTVDDLKKEILERIQTVGYNGGLILGPTHNIQNDTSIEKIEVFFSYAKEVGNF